MRTETSLSPAQAAKLTGRHKTTITRSIDDGKISAIRDEQGRFWIEPAELFRVFPAVADSDAASMQEEEDAPSCITLEDGGKPLKLRDALADAQRVARIEALERELELVRTSNDSFRRQSDETISDLRRRLDASEEERRQKDTQLTHLLTDQRQKEQAAPLPPRRKFLRLFSG